MTHAAARELIAAYALGALETEDLAQIEVHLSECPFCANLADEAALVVEQLCYSVPLQAPPAHSLERLMNSLQTEDQVAAAGSTVTAMNRQFGRWGGWSGRLPFVGLAASLLLAVGLGLWNAELMLNLKGERAVVYQLQDRLARQSDLLFMVTSQDMVSRPLESTDWAPSAQVRLLMDQTKGTAILMANRLPLLPSGYVYRVWLGREGTRQAAGTLVVDDRGNGECMLSAEQPLRMYDSAWVTMDPMEGTPTSTSPGVARGSL